MIREKTWVEIFPIQSSGSVFFKLELGQTLYLTIIDTTLDRIISFLASSISSLHFGFLTSCRWCPSIDWIHNYSRTDGKSFKNQKQAPEFLTFQNPRSTVSWQDPWIWRPANGVLKN